MILPKEGDQSLADRDLSAQYARIYLSLGIVRDDIGDQTVLSAGLYVHRNVKRLIEWYRSKLLALFSP